MKIEMRCERGRLVPVDAEGINLVNSIKAGQSVLAEVIRPRNIRHHRKLMALLNVVYPNTRYPNTYALLSALKTYLGHYEVGVTKGGKEIAVLKSIAFHAMDQQEFEAFYEGCIQAISEHFLPGVTSEQLRAEVEEFLHPRAA